MVQIRFCIVLLLAVDVILAAQGNTTANALDDLEIENKKFKNTRRKGKKSGKGRSTSSSSRSLEEKKSGESNSKDSLELSSEVESSGSKSNQKYKPKSSYERKGWRKWHRKCTPCPEEMAKKWRDPSIKWICGAYQRAQRSFKSLCMMHYRNCQDGTMFVKIHDHRCIDDSERAGKPHGDHFFYDYKVTITGESSRSSDSTTVSESDSPESHIYKRGMFSGERPAKLHEQPSTPKAQPSNVAIQQPSPSNELIQQLSPSNELIQQPPSSHMSAQRPPSSNVLIQQPLPTKGPIQQLLPSTTSKRRPPAIMAMKLPPLPADHRDDCSCSLADNSI